MASSIKRVLLVGPVSFKMEYIIAELLAHDYHVACVVAGPGGQKIFDQAHRGNHYGGRLSCRVVDHPYREGTYDNVVKGVDGVISVAAFVPREQNNVRKDVIEPCVSGIEQLLKSTMKFNPGVKQFIVISSVCALTDHIRRQPPGYVYTEEDWNPNFKHHGSIARKKKETALWDCDVLREHTARKFVRNQKPNFRVTTLPTAAILGPLPLHIEPPVYKSFKSHSIYQLMNPTEPDAEWTDKGNYLDGRDFGAAVRLAYESETTENTRYVLCAGLTSCQELSRIMKKIPEIEGRVQNLPIKNEVLRTTGRKAQNELDVTYRPLDETVLDSVKHLLVAEKASGVPF